MTTPRSASSPSPRKPVSPKLRAQPQRGSSQATDDAVLAEYQILQQRIADAVARQHKFCAAKQACEAELLHITKSRRHDEHNKELATRYESKLSEMRALATEAENAASEVGRYSGDLLMLRLRGIQPAPRHPQ